MSLPLIVKSSHNKSLLEVEPDFDFDSSLLSSPLTPQDEEMLQDILKSHGEAFHADAAQGRRKSNSVFKPRTTQRLQSNPRKLKLPRFASNDDSSPKEYLGGFTRTRSVNPDIIHESHDSSDYSFADTCSRIHGDAPGKDFEDERFDRLASTFPKKKKSDKSTASLFKRTLSKNIASPFKQAC